MALSSQELACALEDIFRITQHHANFRGWLLGKLLDQRIASGEKIIKTKPDNLKKINQSAEPDYPLVEAAKLCGIKAHVLRNMLNQHRIIGIKKPKFRWFNEAEYIECGEREIWHLPLSTIERLKQEQTEKQKNKEARGMRNGK